MKTNVVIANEFLAPHHWIVDILEQENESCKAFKKYLGMSGKQIFYPVNIVFDGSTLILFFINVIPHCSKTPRKKI